MTRKLTIEKAELGFADDSAFDADNNRTKESKGSIWARIPFAKKMYLEDFYKEPVSNCCSASVYHGRCTDCGEPCEEVETE